ncbi:glycerophosphodiester phosphodiesterase, partial [Halorubrum distributum]
MNDRGSRQKADANAETDRADPADSILIGHRGCAGQHPENTVAAVERA